MAVSASQTILFDRALSYTPQGTINFDSPVTFNMPVNIPGGVSEQTINVDTINPFTPSGPVTVTTNLIVNNAVESNTIQPRTGSTITTNGNLTINAADTLSTNTLDATSGSNINIGNNLIMGSGTHISVDTVNPNLTSTTNFTGNVSIDTAHKLEVDTISENTNTRIQVQSTLEMQGGQTFMTDIITPTSAGSTSTESITVNAASTLSTNTINPTSGSNVSINANVITGGIEANTIAPSSGSSIAINASNVNFSGTAFVNVIEPDSGSNVLIAGNVLIPTPSILKVNEIDPDSGSTIVMNGTVDVTPGNALNSNLITQSSGSTVTVTTGTLALTNPGVFTFGTQSELHEVSSNSVLTETSGPNHYAVTSIDYFGGGSAVAMSQSTPMTLQNIWYAIQMTTGSWQNNVQQNFAWSTLSPSTIWQLRYTNPLSTSRNAILRADLTLLSGSAGSNNIQLAWFNNPTVNAITGLITGAPFGTSVQEITLPNNTTGVFASIVFASTIFPGANNYVLGMQCLTNANVNVETVFATVTGITFGNGQY